MHNFQILPISIFLKLEKIGGFFFRSTLTHVCTTGINLFLGLFFCRFSKSQSNFYTPSPSIISCKLRFLVIFAEKPLFNLYVRGTKDRTEFIALLDSQMLCLLFFIWHQLKDSKRILFHKSNEIFVQSKFYSISLMLITDNRVHHFIHTSFSHI